MKVQTHKDENPLEMVIAGDNAGKTNPNVLNCFLMMQFRRSNVDSVLDVKLFE